jgi:hypothetical protein
MGLIDNLHEAQKRATGAAVGAIASVLSLPHATIAGLVDVVNGKSFNDASSAVMAKYAEIGESIGRQQSDEIVRQLINAHNRK